MQKPLILVSNDDGITAPGIRALVQVMQQLGEVIVVAPDSPQSGMGHAITMTRPLRLFRTDIFEGVEAWECSGTPADCVKLAIDKICVRRPDLMVSGINHGPNSSINVIYSGTMSAAVEASVDGIQAIGFSLCDYDHEADFEPSKPFVKQIAETVLKHGLPAGTLLNVNIPKATQAELKGVRVCRQAHGKYAEQFDERTDPFGRKYYWMTGKFVNMDPAADSDLAALDGQYISIVPTQFDLTAYNSLKTVENMFA